MRDTEEREAVKFARVNYCFEVPNERPAGQMFIEAPEQVHAVSRNASNTESAKLLAILLTRKGAVLTTPVKQ